MTSGNEEWVFTLDLGSKASAFAYGQDGLLEKYGKFISDKSLVKETNHPKILKTFASWLSKTINLLPTKPSVVIIESPYWNRNAHTYKILCMYLGVALMQIARSIPNAEIIQMPPATVKQILKVPKGKTHKERKVNMVKKINKLHGLRLRYNGTNKENTDDDVADAIALLDAYFIQKSRKSNDGCDS